MKIRLRFDHLSYQLQEHLMRLATEKGIGIGKKIDDLHIDNLDIDDQNEIINLMLADIRDRHIVIDALAEFINDALILAYKEVVHERIASLEFKIDGFETNAMPDMNSFIVLHGGKQ
jgi:predicted GTPase